MSGSLESNVFQIHQNVKPTPPCRSITQTMLWFGSVWNTECMVANGEAELAQLVEATWPSSTCISQDLVEIYQSLPASSGIVFHSSRKQKPHNWDFHI